MQSRQGMNALLGRRQRNVYIGADDPNAPLAAPANSPATDEQMANALKDAETVGTIWFVASALSSAASAYHGYKRNNSVGWGIVWGILGGMFPIITPAIGVAEGFGKRAK